jgi:hypothetical protein
MVQVLVWVCVAVACFVVGQWIGKKLFGVKKDVSKLKRSMQSLAITLREHGLRRLPEALEEAVVGDVDDIFVAVKDFATVVKAGNEAIVCELEGTFNRMLDNKLTSPEGRALVEAKLNEAKKVAIEVAKVVAPIAAKAAVVAVL